MSYESPAWENITDSSTAAPSPPHQDGYVLLLVLLSIFIGGTLLLLTGVLVLCRRCCDSRLRLSRPSDDAEKTNTSYVEELQPPHDITIRVEEAESLSASGLRDVESERFLCTASSGRRVSFNEGALCGQEKRERERERGRRYTLTEGDFHYLKNARLTLTPLPSLPPSALHILTIHESEGGESSSSGGASETRPPSPSKSNISIYQPPYSSQAPLTRLSLSLGSALPGDMYSSVTDTSFMETQTRSPHSSGQNQPRARGGGGSDAAPPRSHGAVLHFFNRLRRHASLEGASPYLKMKKWKLGSTQRASSLDTRGSPKRHQFQRQRAASESAERDDIIQYIARTQDTNFPSPPGPFVSHHGTPSHSLGRLDRGEEVSLSDLVSTDQPQLPPQCDIWSLRASLELCASDQSSSNDRDSVRSDADSVCSLSGLPSLPSQDLPDTRPARGTEPEPGSRKLLQMDSGYASIEAPCRPPEDPRSAHRDKTASEKRLFFTHAGRKGTVFESLEGRLFEEGAVGGEEAWLPPHTETLTPQDSASHRDYSIDEKTDALFNEFLRHDPQYDDSPLRAKHRSRAHLRKQWQRTKQYSDPGVRYAPALDRHRVPPLRRGDSTSYLTDTRYHSTLPRIASSTDEEGADGCPQSPASLTPDSEDKIQAIEEEPCEHGPAPEDPANGDPQQDTPPGYGPQTTELMDKISAGLEERLYTHMHRAARSPERLLTVAHISPDHSPV